MKHLLAFLTLIGLFTQCTISEIVPPSFTGRLGEDVILTPKQTVVLTTESDIQRANSINSITVLITEAKEGRCAPGMQCLLAGSATASLQISKGKTLSQSVDFCLGDCPGREPYRTMDTSYFKLGTEEYVADLKSIKSHAKSIGKPQKVQQLTIQIQPK